MDLIKQCVEDLEGRIDPVAESDLWNQWEAFWDGECESSLFQPSINRGQAPGFDWPEVHINDAIENPELTVIHQLKGVSNLLAAKTGGSVLSVRSNYGVGIMASLFGSELFMMPREQNCLPNVRALPGGEESIKKILDQGIPDLRSGLGARVLDTGALFVQLFSDYPSVQRHVHIYHPDLQGPMDGAELLWGSGIFLAFFDHADLVHDLLSLICETYSAFMKEWWKISHPGNELNCHWTQVWKGNIVLRDDSAMNLSPEMFDAFIFPYDQRLLNELGGGGIHACGKVDHWIESMSRMDNLFGFNMSQPSYNDMETVYRHTVDKRIKLIGLNRETAEQAAAAGRPMLGRVEC